MTNEPLTNAVPAIRAGLGLRGRLLLAFSGIGMLTVVAGLSGHFAFNAVNRALNQTGATIPPALAAVELTRETEQVLSSGPRMLNARSEDEIERHSDTASSDLRTINRLVDLLRTTAIDQDALDGLSTNISKLSENLSKLKIAAIERVQSTSRRVKLTNDFFSSYRDFGTVWNQNFSDLQVEVLRHQNSLTLASTPEDRRVASTPEDRRVAINRFELAVATLQSLEQIQRETSQAFEFVTRGASVDDGVQLQSQASLARRAMLAVEGRIDDLDQEFAAGLLNPTQRLDEIIAGKFGIFVTRHKEIEANRDGQQLVELNSALGEQLAVTVSRLVDRARKDINTTTQEAHSVQKLGDAIQLGVIALSLISSVLIGWLYVERNIVARLTALSGRMLTLAQGDLKSPLPHGGTDEIGRMAEALLVFRATAIEMEETNLKEIREARTRLTDAIETISEGFALYDADDKLVVCNNRYKGLFVDHADVIEPGTTFEKIVRTALERGLIEDANRDREAWLAKRITQHRAASSAHTQRRSDGRWVQVNERKTAAGGVVATYADITELKQRESALAASLDDLRTAQDRLVQTEKLASLGQLTAGIAHEIKNPLNFVNNFSALSAELIDELDETLAPAPLDQKMRGDVGELTQMLKSNLEKVVQHGKRADSIVKNMLLHSREGSGEHRPADINALLDESLNLAYHGARAEKPGFNVTLQKNFDPSAGAVELFPQEITRAFLNLISNGFYAVTKRKTEVDNPGFEPLLSATTRDLGNTVEIRIRDNGTGIPTEVKDKMFNPFFTTKPAGQGTGLGLSMSHDIIVKQHGGKIDVETEPGQFTEFTIVLPRTSRLSKTT